MSKDLARKSSRMRRVRLVLTFAAAPWLVAPLASAQPMDGALPADAPARLAIGAWAGRVCWNEPAVSYT